MINKKRLSIFSVSGILMFPSIILLSFYSLFEHQNYDWSMWRYDANRSASSPQELPSKLHLQWVIEYPQLKQAWEDPLNQDLMQFDKVYEPIVLGKTLIVGSSASDRLTAIDTDTGKEKWVFYVDGPIRFPPVGYKDKVYFTSDDGYLYCVKARNGKLIWKFRGGPTDRKILGNERLISTWPARGGPVLKDGIVYFASGIWSFMGVSIYAIEANTGKVIWANDSAGSMYMLQPHNSPSYAGIAPQGTLVISGDKLLVPCGRSVPACFNLKTGELIYYHLAKYNKTGGAFVCAQKNFFISYHRDFVTSIYDLEKGESAIAQFGKIPVMTQDEIFCMGNSVTAFDFANIRQIEYDKEVKDSTTQEVKIVKEKKWVMDEFWKCDVDASGDLIKSGSMLYAGGKNVVSAIKIPSGKNEPIISWKTDIEGTATRIISADKKLFVVTLEGKIYAFGGKNTEPKIYKYNPKRTPISKKALVKVDSILKTVGIKDGYCLAYGLKDGEILEALVQKSELCIIAIDPDPDKVKRLRRKFDASGIYGKRISIQVGDPLSFDAPPYIASLTVFENFEEKNYKNSELLYKKIYKSTRPYGGVVYLPVNSNEILSVKQQIQKSNLPKAVIRDFNGFLLLVREGQLPGSDDWTHQYGDIANTVKSDDQLVKLPLGILWFGGSPNTDVLPRHGHGPPEQVIGGRLFIEGMDCISARDVYTGRVIWKKKIPKLDNYGIFYDGTYKDAPLNPAYNQVHIPGANARSTNFVATQDKIYVIQKDSCLVLDPATGETLGEIFLPLDKKTGQPQEWGYIGVYKDYLIAGASFVSYTNSLDIDPKITSNAKSFLNYDITSSKSLVIMDRTGKVLWTRDSNLGFRHNAIAIGADKIFCIDMLPPTVSDTLKRRGEKPLGTPKLMALDLQRGKMLWETTENVFGTWLSYSEKYDILIQATRKSRDMLTAESDKCMATYKGENGTPLWNNDATYGGPIMLHSDRIITDQYAYNILTGKKEMRIDPLTGESKPWEFKRNYGCNYAIASEHLLTFRSAAAGFFDLDSDGGTGNFGGFKSGCTSNLIAANGVLNAPDYTRTCSCSYQNQASLAMVYTPDVEIWTDYSGEIGDGPIKTVGINFGAIGDRRANNGTLWLEYPIVGGPSPEVAVTINPKDCERFIKHSSKIYQDARLGSEIVPAWVVSSGIKGVSSLNIKLSGKSTNDSAQERPYTVRLFFSEPDDIKISQRRFDITIQERKILEDFDIIRESGGQDCPIVREFKGIIAKGDLKIDFAPSKNSNKTPLICGIEIIAENIPYHEIKNTIY